MYRVHDTYVLFLCVSRNTTIKIVIQNMNTITETEGKERTKFWKGKIINIDTIFIREQTRS